jgi:hypothetical protein
MLLSEWVGHLTIPRSYSSVPRPNIVSETGYTEICRGFLHPLQAVLEQLAYHKITHARFLPHPFQFIIYSVILPVDAIESVKVNSHREVAQESIS